MDETGPRPSQQDIKRLLLKSMIEHPCDISHADLERRVLNPENGPVQDFVARNGLKPFFSCGSIHIMESIVSEIHGALPPEHSACESFAFQFAEALCCAHNSGLVYFVDKGRCYDFVTSPPACVCCGSTMDSDPFNDHPLLCSLTCHNITLSSKRVFTAMAKVKESAIRNKGRIFKAEIEERSSFSIKEAMESTCAYLSDSDSAFMVLNSSMALSKNYMNGEQARRGLEVVGCTSSHIMDGLNAEKSYGSLRDAVPQTLHGSHPDASLFFHNRSYEVLPHNHLYFMCNTSVITATMKMERCGANERFLEGSTPLPFSAESACRVFGDDLGTVLYSVLFNAHISPIVRYLKSARASDISTSTPYPLLVAMCYATPAFMRESTSVTKSIRYNNINVLHRDIPQCEHLTLLRHLGSNRSEIVDTYIMYLSCMKPFRELGMEACVDMARMAIHGAHVHDLLSRIGSGATYSGLPASEVGLFPFLACYMRSPSVVKTFDKGGRKYIGTEVSHVSIPFHHLAADFESSRTYVSNAIEYLTLCNRIMKALSKSRGYWRLPSHLSLPSNSFFDQTDRMRRTVACATMVPFLQMRSSIYKEVREEVVASMAPEKADRSSVGERAAEEIPGSGSGLAAEAEAEAEAKGCKSQKGGRKRRGGRKKTRSGASGRSVNTSKSAEGLEEETCTNRPLDIEEMQCICNYVLHTHCYIPLKVKEPEEVSCGDMGCIKDRSEGVWLCPYTNKNIVCPSINDVFDTMRKIASSESTSFRVPFRKVKEPRWSHVDASTPEGAAGYTCDLATLACALTELVAITDVVCSVASTIHCNMVCMLKEEIAPSRSGAEPYCSIPMKVDKKVLSEQGRSLMYHGMVSGHRKLSDYVCKFDDGIRGIQVLQGIVASRIEARSKLMKMLCIVCKAMHQYNHSSGIPLAIMEAEESASINDRKEFMRVVVGERVYTLLSKLEHPEKMRYTPEERGDGDLLFGNALAMIMRYLSSDPGLARCACLFWDFIVCSHASFMFDSHVLKKAAWDSLIYGTPGFMAGTAWSEGVGAEGNISYGIDNPAALARIYKRMAGLYCAADAVRAYIRDHRGEVRYEIDGVGKLSINRLDLTVYVLNWMDFSEMEAERKAKGLEGEVDFNPMVALTQGGIIMDHFGSKGVQKAYGLFYDRLRAEEVIQCAKSWVGESMSQHHCAHKDRDGGATTDCVPFFPVKGGTSPAAPLCSHDTVPPTPSSDIVGSEEKVEGDTPLNSSKVPRADDSCTLPSGSIKEGDDPSSGQPSWSERDADSIKIMKMEIATMEADQILEEIQALACILVPKNHGSNPKRPMSSLDKDVSLMYCLRVRYMCLHHFSYISERMGMNGKQLREYCWGVENGVVYPFVLVPNGKQIEGPCIRWHFLKTKWPRRLKRWKFCRK